MNQMEDIDRDSTVTLRKTLNEHMKTMFDRASDALEIISKTQDDTDEFKANLSGQKQEDENSDSLVSEGQTPLTIHPLTCKSEDGEIFKKYLDLFLSTNVEETLSAATTSIQFYLSIGMRYYLERLRDEKYFMFTDLPEMLEVDRKTNELITACLVISRGMPDTRTKFKRSHNSAIGKRTAPEGPEMAWEKVKSELRKLDQEEEWSISGIAGEIHNKIGKTQGSIINYFKEHLGNEVTGSRGKAKRYRISELISMCDRK